MTEWTEIVLRDSDGRKAQIRVPTVEMELGDVFGELLRPALIAFGFTESAIIDYVGGGE